MVYIRKHFVSIDQHHKTKSSLFIAVLNQLNNKKKKQKQNKNQTKTKNTKPNKK